MTYWKLVGKLYKGDNYIDLGEPITDRDELPDLALHIAAALSGYTGRDGFTFADVDSHGVISEGTLTFIWSDNEPTLPGPNLPDEMRERLRSRKAPTLKVEEEHGVSDA